MHKCQILEQAQNHNTKVSFSKPFFMTYHMPDWENQHDQLSCHPHP